LRCTGDRGINHDTIALLVGGELLVVGALLLVDGPIGIRGVGIAARAFGEPAANFLLVAHAFDEYDWHPGAARHVARGIAMGTALKGRVENRAASAGELAPCRLVHRGIGGRAALRAVEGRTGPGRGGEA